MSDQAKIVKQQERDLLHALGMGGGSSSSCSSLQEGVEQELVITDYDVVPDPNAEKVDLSELRGVTSGEKKNTDNSSEHELEGLAELVPDVKARRPSHGMGGASMTTDNVVMPAPDEAEKNVMSMQSQGASSDARRGMLMTDYVKQNESMRAVQSKDVEDKPAALVRQEPEIAADNHSSGREDDTDTYGDYPGSDHALEDEDESEQKVSKEFINMSSANSLSTATQTHEVRMPMYLPTFKPATGCTNASDFIVRCFVARLRSGITVVKHGRSRWCKSRLRVLHIHPDGRSLSWRPAEGEPTSSKRPPKLDLSTCLEVRHAWSPDPQNPMYTGTPILRQKCEAANAHKSFALIFKQRTVDITAVTADQCKVLMEGFSALCFRLQVANLAARGKKGQARPMPEEDGISTTASATLTNTSQPRR